jgi:hypothetical protein
MIPMDDIKVETVDLGDGDIIVVVTHLPSGRNEVIDFPSTDSAVKRAVAKIAQKIPYSGDPGDESDHERWEGEGGQ